MQSAVDSFPVAGAVLVIDDQTRNKRSLRSSTNGVFIVDSLAPGRHTLRVFYIGFVQLDTAVVLRDSSVASFLVRLHARQSQVNY